MAKKETTPLGNALRLARISKGWKLKDAEIHTGINKVVIGSYERAYRLPPINVLIKLAADYDTTVATLIGENCQKCNADGRIAALEALLKTIVEAK